MNKSDVIQEVCRECGVPREVAKEVLDRSFAVIAGHVARGEAVSLSGFGVFTARPMRRRKQDSSASEGRQGVSLTFRTSQTLKKRLAAPEKVIL